ncbi:MAG: hypothetical protein QM765_44175 [Myxococcales bacterium]
MSTRPVCHLALVVLVFAASACGHPLDEGTWRVSQDRQASEAIDPCMLLAQDGSVGDGKLVVTGVELRLNTVVPGVPTPVLMIGRLKNPAANQPDEFVLQGSASAVVVQVKGAACQLQFGQIEIAAQVRDARRFDGTMTAHYELGLSPDSGCPSVCDFQVGVSGTWMSP